MKQIKDIKNKLEWEQYYNPEFDWNDHDFYRNNKLTEDFIREFQDKVNWFDISEYQKLSENFIREFIDKVDLLSILLMQDVSKKFKEECTRDFKKLF